MATAAISIGLALVGLFCAASFAADCSELPSVDVTRGCEVAGDFWSPMWWAAALWPAVLFAASRVIPKLRLNAWVTLVVTAVLMAVFWIALFVANP